MKAPIRPLTASLLSLAIAAPIAANAEEHEGTHRVDAASLEEALSILNVWAIDQTTPPDVSLWDDTSTPPEGFPAEWSQQQVYMAVAIAPALKKLAAHGGPAVLGWMAAKGLRLCVTFPYLGLDAEICLPPK